MDADKLDDNIWSIESKPPRKVCKQKSFKVQMKKRKTLRKKQHKSRQLLHSEDDISVDAANRTEINLKDMNDEKKVLRILNKRLIKEKVLVCETCGIVRKSAAGFLSHLQCCGKSTKELAQMRKACEACGKFMLPSSLQTHMNTIHKELEEPLEEIICEKTTKRAAAVKAAMRMQQFMEEISDQSERSSPTNVSM